MRFFKRRKNAVGSSSNQSGLEPDTSSPATSNLVGHDGTRSTAQSTAPRSSFTDPRPAPKPKGATKTPPGPLKGQLTKNEYHRLAYRVRGITPAQSAGDKLKSDLAHALLLHDDSLVRVRSMSRDLPRASHVSSGQLRSFTAIVSFGCRLQEAESENFTVNAGGNDLYFDSTFTGFTPLSRWRSMSAGPQFDCIVIPGWGGHPIGSFMAQDSPYVWLIDDLPRDFPTFNIWTYGYSPPLNKQASGEDLSEFADTFVRLLRVLRQRSQHAQRDVPIIYLAHSLGGLMLKEAIIRQRSSKDLTDKVTLQCTFGALFFAVPGSGMEVEALAAMVNNLPARTTLFELDRRIGHRLRHKLHNEFCDAFDFKDSIIARFYELEESPTVVMDPKSRAGWSRSGPPKLLVDFESATKARPSDTDIEWIVGLRGNHSTLVKLPQYSNESYDKIQYTLIQMSDLAPSAIAERFTSSAGPHREKQHPGRGYPPISMRTSTRNPEFEDLEQASWTSSPVRTLTSKTAIEPPISSTQPREKRRPELTLNLKNIDADIHVQKQALERERSECLASLKFPEMNSRQRRVDDRAEHTCQWLLENSAWIRWFAENKSATCREFLWIKGKPGSGKSTLMKYISHILARKADSVLVNFFFDARGSSLEKSLLGLFSSIIHGLLCQIPQLVDLLLVVRREKIKRDDPAWKEAELQDFFRSTITALGKRQLYIQIDALDECEEADNANHMNERDLMAYFEEILITASEMSHNVSLVLSSRHYPHIEPTRGFEALEIHMEQENRTDIQNYVMSWLESGRNYMLGSDEDEGTSGASPKPLTEVDFPVREIRWDQSSTDESTTLGLPYRDIDRATLVDEVVERSAGVFLWVKLVVRQLKIAQDRGKPNTYLKRILGDIPRDLNDLFEQIMWDIDPDDQLETDKLIRWVLFATAPMDISALHSAMIFDSDMPPRSIDRWKERPTYVPVVKFNARMRDLSRGLVETRESRGNQCAYFIHDTVRTFFLQSWRVSEEREKRLRDNYLMMVACLNLFKIKEMQKQDITELAESVYSTNAPGTPYFATTKFKFSHTSEGYGNIDLFNDKIPFWRYATSSLLLHARDADPALAGQFLASEFGGTWPLAKGSLYWVWERFYQLYGSVAKDYAQTELRLWKTLYTVQPDRLPVRNAETYFPYPPISDATDVLFYAALYKLVSYTERLSSSRLTPHAYAVVVMASIVGDRRLLSGRLLGARDADPDDLHDGDDYAKLIETAKAMPDYAERLKSFAEELTACGTAAPDEPASTPYGTSVQFTPEFLQRIMFLLTTYRPLW